MKNIKILVLGATGMLGSVLVPYLDSRQYTVLTHGHSNAAQFGADLRHYDETKALINKTSPDVIINLVGLTSVEECEDNIRLAYSINTRVVENIASAICSLKTQSYLVHISTDQLYDGPGLHCENDVTITNNYGMTKYAGELAASSVDSAILRTNFIGRSSNNKRESLTDWVFKSCVEGRDVFVIDDVFFSPLSMITLSEMIDLVVNSRLLGTFNIGSKDGMSKADFDFLFAERLGLPTSKMSRIAISKADFLRAYRPKNMCMQLSKIESELGIKLPTLESELKRVVCEYV